jgi:hypothetical protein
MASPIVTPVSDTVNVVEAEKEALVSIERTKLLELTAIEEKDPWLGGLVPWVPKVAAEKNPKKEFQLEIHGSWRLQCTVVNNGDSLCRSGAADKFTL